MNLRVKDVKEALLKSGVSPKVIDQLFKLGIDEVRYMTSSELVEKLKIDSKTARKILRAIGSTFVEIKPASEVIMHKKRLKIGVKEIDDLLGGGLEQGTLIELYGRPASGKTQMAMHITINARLDEKEGGLSTKVFYIDTERGFSPARIEEMCRFRGLDPQKIMDGILYVSAGSTHELFVAAERALDLIKDEGVGLIIVDSLLSPFRLEFQGIKELAPRQQAVKELMRILKRACEKDAIVFLTNQVVGRVGRGIETEKYRPAGGFVLGHIPNLVLLIRRLKGNRRLIRVVDSSYLEEGEAIFAIDKAGIVPVSPDW
ncbi:MAG: hypothetical protein DRN90_01025 [Thermoproteota archaeon]|nr:MAG: hypothetical protein DRN90_01025 [Candidatus Korarchaeota archaeon]